MASDGDWRLLNRHVIIVLYIDGANPNRAIVHANAMRAWHFPARLCEEPSLS